MAFQAKKTTTTRRSLNTNNLFAPAVNISGIDELTVATEKQLHTFLHLWVDDTVEAVKAKIVEYNVLDTTATYNSVYGVYPVERHREKILRGDASLQYDEVSVKTLVSYQAAKSRAKELRRSLKNETRSVDQSTGRPIHKGDASQLNFGARDTQFQPIGRVKRGNLYAGVGVATWYAWFPHEGYGQAGGVGVGRNSGGKNHEPRRFFSEPVKEQQAKLIIAMDTGLERTIKGRLRQSTNGAVRRAYDAG